jgi:hypothetical protein
MGKQTFELIQSHTVTGSNSSGFNFNDIPQTYTDLRLLIHATDNTSGSITCYPNNNSGANKSRTNLYVNAATPNGASGRASGNTGLYFDIGGNAGWKGVTTVDINNYTDTNKFKAFIWRWANGNATTAANGFWIATWGVATNITSLNFASDGGGATIEVGSTFKLYGIKAF